MLPTALAALVALGGLAGLAGLLVVSSAPSTAEHSGTGSFAPALMPGDYVTISCLGGYLKLDGSQVCDNATVPNVPWDGGGTANYTVTGGCNRGPCNNPASGPWGYSAAGVCIGATGQTCATYRTLPSQVSPVNMWAYCPTGDRCVGSLSMWAQQPPLYTVTFVESGLGSGDQWGVSFLGGNTNTTLSSIQFSVPNGTWDYSVFAPDGYAATPTGGAISVTGANVQKTIAYAGDGRVIANITLSSESPVAVAYDNLSDSFVVAENPGQLQWFGAGNRTVLHTVSLSGSTLKGIAFDWTDNEVFVTDVSNLGDFTVVFAAGTAALVTSISVKSAPTSVAYDGKKNDVFVSLPGTGVAVITASNNKVTKTISLTTDATGIAYEAGQGIVIASDTGGEASEITDSNLDVKQTVSVAGCTTPAGSAYDSVMAKVYLTCAGSNNVKVLTSTLGADTSVSVSPQTGPTIEVYGNGCLWVVDDETHGNVTVIADSSSTANTVVNTVAVGSAPDGIAYSSAYNDLFVTNSGSDTISVLTAT